MNLPNHLYLFVLAAALLAGCTKQSGTAANPDVDYYTCTMHPSVHSHDANAKCPICSMDLVPVKKKGTGGSMQGDAIKTVEGMPITPQSTEFMVPVERQQQIGVTYAAAETKPLHQTVRTVGMVAPDQTRHWEFVARVDGYVEKLYVTSPGEPVQKDQPLLTIYSPDLLTAERELVSLLDTRDRTTTQEGKASTNRLIDSSRRRLEQWNIMPAQIAELEKTRKPTEFLTLQSPFNGVVEDVPVHQGRKVMTGDHLVDVADLSLVWVWAEFYENEAPMLMKGQKVTVTTKSYPGEKFEGDLSLVSPFLNEMKRTAKARIDIPNPDLKLHPGMYVEVELGLDKGTALTIPISAVMPTGARTLVFVGKGGGMIEPRFIQLGGKYGDLYEVQSGLKEGESVVASANFLIDAESKVQGAVKSFEEPAMAEPQKPPMPTVKAPLPKEASALYQPVIASYLNIQKSLAQDKLDGLAAQIAQLRELVQAVTKSTAKPEKDAEDYQKHVGALAVTLDQFKAGTLEEARVSFGKVSAVLIAVVNEFPPPLSSTVYIMNCPMWEKSAADWLQTTEAIENPFMGKKMTGCGDVVKTIAVGK